MNRQEAEKIKDDLAESFTAGCIYTQPEPEYIPFEYTDFKDFMLKQVRRKGEEFKDEICTIIGVIPERVCVAIDNDILFKSFSSMFEEWEFADGKPFGILKK